MQGQFTRATQEWASLFTNFPVKAWWRRAPVWLSVLFVVLVARSAADMTWLIFAPQVQSVVGQRLAAAPLPGGPQDTANQPRLQTVAALHLFGEARQKPVVRDAPIEAPKTGLKLTLRGVFAASVPEQAMALIADARGDEKVYQKSDTIFSGVTLYAIYPDKVILERGGNFETLNLPRDESVSARPVNHVQRQTRPAVVNRNTTADVVRTRTVRAGKRLEQLKQQITENPADFWKNVRIEPVTDENQQIKGYTFSHNDRQMMRALGLRPGDVITEVNGQQVTDPSVLSGLMGELGSASELTLGIERNGRKENININM